MSDLERRRRPDHTRTPRGASEPAPVRRSARPLRVERSDSPAEDQADRVAEAALRRSSVPGVRASLPATRIARSSAAMGAAGGELDDATSDRIRRRAGRGAPLDDGTRGAMEQAFGADFSAVRVHTDAESADLNRSLAARAFTSGSDVFFGGGEYRPDTDAGRHVLAHELAHTVQSGAAETVHRWPWGKKKDKANAVDPNAPPTNAPPVNAPPTNAPPVNQPDRAPDYGLVREMRVALDVAKTHNNTYDVVEKYGRAYVTQHQQKQLADVASHRQRSKGDQDKRSLKDLLRAFVLYTYVEFISDKFLGRHAPVDPDALPALTPGERKQIDTKYFAITLRKKNDWAGLIAKGPHAPETLAWLQEAGLEDAIQVDDTARAAVASGPKIDVRATYIGGTLLGAPRRMHLFIIYTTSDGDQFFLRGGPDDNDPPFTIADYGPYTPSGIDWDPKAPSVTVAQGPKAKEKFDKMLEVCNQINGLKVPYVASEFTTNKKGVGSGLLGAEAFINGENCNSTAYTILKAAGVPRKKPGGVHPGWGHILGQFKGQGGQLAAPEDDSGNAGTAMKIRGGANTTVQVFSDRSCVEKLASVAGGSDIVALRSTTTTMWEGGETEVDAVKIRFGAPPMEGWVPADAVSKPAHAGRFWTVGDSSRLVTVNVNGNQEAISGGLVITVHDPGFVTGTRGQLVEVSGTDRYYGNFQGFIRSDDVTDQDPANQVQPVTLRCGVTLDGAAINDLKKSVDWAKYFTRDQLERVLGDADDLNAVAAALKVDANATGTSMMMAVMRMPKPQSPPPPPVRSDAVEFDDSEPQLIDDAELEKLFDELAAVTTGPSADVSPRSPQVEWRTYASSNITEIRLADADEGATYDLPGKQIALTGATARTTLGNIPCLEAMNSKGERFWITELDWENFAKVGA